MRLGLFYGVALTMLSAVGCGGSSQPAPTTELTATSIDGSKYLLSDEPDGALGVIDARESSQDGDAVVIVGRIGGATNPWVEGRAAFTLLDASMSLMAAGEDDEEGELCLEDCCAADRAECTTLVKVVDADGKLLAADSRQLLGLAENDTVVVRGEVNKDESGNFSVLADGVHVRR